MKPIFIVGYMGAGKSTIGRKLAQEMGLSFIDTDIFIENRFRQRVSDIFASVGEEVFRRRERVIIEELSGMQNCIIATGGGLPCYNGNMELMRSEGFVIYLSACDQVLAERLELCKRTRPTISHKSGDKLLEHVTSTMLLRRTIYEEAHLQINVDTLTCEEDEWTLARELARQLSTSKH